MELGHLLTRSGLTYPEVSSKFYHDSFCQLGSSISLPWVISFEAFYLHVVSSSSCIPVICTKLVLFLTPSQFVHLFCNLSKCSLLFFSCIWYENLLLWGYFFMQHYQSQISNIRTKINFEVMSDEYTVPTRTRNVFLPTWW